MKPQASIHFHIEELVLHGFASGDRHQIGEAVQRELTRLILEQKISRQLRGNKNIERLDAGSFRAAPGKISIGNQIAGAVHQAISQ